MKILWVPQTDRATNGPSYPISNWARLYRKWMVLMMMVAESPATANLY